MAKQIVYRCKDDKEKLVADAPGYLKCPKCKRIVQLPSEPGELPLKQSREAPYEPGQD